MTKTLFEAYKLNDKITLKNKIAMAPLTRCMADDDLVPTDAMVDYYAKRADAGLIISEATIIRADGQGYPNTPGLFTQAQIEGWKKSPTLCTRTAVRSLPSFGILAVSLIRTSLVESTY